MISGVSHVMSISSLSPCVILLSIDLQSASASFIFRERDLETVEVGVE